MLFDNKDGYLGDVVLAFLEKEKIEEANNTLSLFDKPKGLDCIKLSISVIKAFYKRSNKESVLISDELLKNMIESFKSDYQSLLGKKEKEVKELFKNVNGLINYTSFEGKDSLISDELKNLIESLELDYQSLGEIEIKAIFKNVNEIIDYTIFEEKDALISDELKNLIELFELCTNSLKSIDRALLINTENLIELTSFCVERNKKEEVEELLNIIDFNQQDLELKIKFLMSLASSYLNGQPSLEEKKPYFKNIMTKMNLEEGSLTEQKMEWDSKHALGVLYNVPCTSDFEVNLFLLKSFLSIIQGKDLSLNIPFEKNYS
jgi:hypothetical protein